ncbi:hypothetical protein CU103_28000 [Phyllobacterium sophorae]|uniref:DUF2380 domain-containing protein n=2 Tax=Phyllobacterium sophorae TaxID=1520277 RepID=A0A2P7ATY6_9HYPH|nr:hypothetical protein CU103_28000 [Phyllobacterium sophorae]
MMEMNLRTSFAAAALTASMVAPPAYGDAKSPAPAAAKISVAVANLDFLDTSGETRDMTAAHAKRLKALADYLREQLSGNENLKVVQLPCEQAQCTAQDPGYEVLADQARDAGARFVFIGIVKKTSTLINWIEYSVLDVDDKRAVCGELVSFRDDTDESWRRASRFLGSQIARRCKFGG